MKTIAVIFGGRSTEHDVSIVTAIASVIKPLELTKEYKVEPVYIAKDGSWYWNEKLKDISIYSSGEITTLLKKLPKTHILFDNGFTLVTSSGFAGRKVYKKVDIVFPAMHGTNGEDGALMGLLEMANVPYVGCGLSASAVAMDKVLSKQVVTSAGIPSTPWTWFYSRDLAQHSRRILKDIESLNYPLFVKPAHLGSSIGITKVDKKDQLMNALEVAAHFDDKVIVEQGVQNLKEVTLPIVGEGDTMQPASLEQPLFKSDDFFDFEKKYLGQGGKKGSKKMGAKAGGKRGAQGYSQIPADLPKAIYDSAVNIGMQVYHVTGCAGIARVDMLIDSKTKKIYFNEINPLPGSLYAHNWRASGVSNVELVQKLVHHAEERFQQKKQLETVFSTSFLKQF